MTTQAGADSTARPKRLFSPQMRRECFSYCRLQQWIQLWYAIHRGPCGHPCATRRAHAGREGQLRRSQQVRGDRGACVVRAPSSATIPGVDDVPSLAVRRGSSLAVMSTGCEGGVLHSMRSGQAGQRVSGWVAPTVCAVRRMWNRMAASIRVYTHRPFPASSATHPPAHARRISCGSGRALPRGRISLGRGMPGRQGYHRADSDARVMVNCLSSVV